MALVIWAAASFPFLQTPQGAWPPNPAQGVEAGGIAGPWSLLIWCIVACVVLYLLPATSALGAVLLTGFRGGAIAIHVRVGDPLFSHVLFPTYVGALVWAGLLLRDDRWRELAPAVRERAVARV